MKRVAYLAILLLAGTASAIFAQSSFNGTLKLDVGALPTPKGPFVWLLQGGMYECKSCVPPIRIKADGQDQAVTGQPYDTISVTILNDRTVREIEKKTGQLVSDETYTVSPDGNTATDQLANWKVTMNRTASGPPGSHALSGTWNPLKLESTSDRGFLVTFKLDGDTLSMSRPTGESYRAKLDGTEAPVNGDPNVTTVSLKRIGSTTIEETDKRNGTVVSVVRLAVAPDGKSMTITEQDVAAGTSIQFTAYKQ